MKVRVHSVSIDKIQTMAKLPGGQEVQVLAPGLTVELVEVDGDTTITRRFIPEDFEAALELYVLDAVLTVTFAPEE